MKLSTMFKNSTITMRLLGGFGAVITMLAIVVAAGLAYLDSLTDQIEVLANSRVPQVIAAGKWEASVLRTARHMQIVFIPAGSDEVLQELKAIRENRDEQAALLAQIRSLAAGEKATQLLQEADAARKSYLASEAQFIEQAEAGRIEESKITLLVKTRPAQMAYIAGISRLAAHFGEEAREMSRQAASDYHRGVAGLVLATLLCVLAASAIALLIARGLRRELGGEPAYASAVVRQVAGGDLTVDVQVARGDQDSLLFAMREMIANLQAMVGETAKGAQSVADTSAQIAQGNLDLSQRTEEQAGTLEEAASSMEELTSTVARNAQNAKQASELAASAAKTAQDGGEVVDEVVTTMDQILDASKKIGDIISVIDAIAFQTNILALNAAVEAARAGEQGRGFAVVAAEVRNLAHRTAVAAKEIKALIADSTQKVEAGSSRVDAAGHAMVGVVLSVKKVSEHIAQIAAASQDQSAKINQVSSAVKQMDTVVQQNASLVEEAAAATESMKEQAAGLLEMVSRFRVGQEQPFAAAGAPALQAPVRTRAEFPAPALAAARKVMLQPQGGAGGWTEF